MRKNWQRVSLQIEEAPGCLLQKVQVPDDQSTLRPSCAMRNAGEPIQRYNNDAQISYSLEPISQTAFNSNKKSSRIIVTNFLLGTKYNHKMHCPKCKITKIVFGPNMKCDECESSLSYKCDICDQLLSTHACLRAHVLNFHIVDSCQKLEDACNSENPLQHNQFNSKDNYTMHVENRLLNKGKILSIP